MNSILLYTILQFEILLLPVFQAGGHYRIVYEMLWIQSQGYR